MDQGLLTFAFVLFVIGAFLGWGQPDGRWYGRFNLVSGGLAFWVLVYLIKAWGKHGF